MFMLLQQAPSDRIQTFQIVEQNLTLVRVDIHRERPGEVQAEYAQQGFGVHHEAALPKLNGIRETVGDIDEATDRVRPIQLDRYRPQSAHPM